MTSLQARLAFHKLTKSLWLSVKQKERLKMNPQVNEHGAFYIWIAQEVSTGEILGSYTQKTQAIKHAQSFVGGDESEIISDKSLETVFVGGNIAKVTKVKTETLRVWD